MGFFSFIKNEFNLGRAQADIQSKLEILQKEIDTYSTILIMEGWSQVEEDRLFNILFARAHLLMQHKIILNKQPEVLGLINDKVTPAYRDKILLEAREYKSTLGQMTVNKFIEEMGTFYLTKFVRLYQTLNR